MCFLKSSRTRDVVSAGSTSGECTLSEPEEPRREDHTEEDDTVEDHTEEGYTGEPRGEETTTEASLARAEETIQNCCPDSRRILMIGESGVGKSTLGNRLL